MVRSDDTLATLLKVRWPSVNGNNLINIPIILFIIYVIDMYTIIILSVARPKQSTYRLFNYQKNITILEVKNIT